MDEQKSPCVLEDFVPFGAAAEKEKARESQTKREIKTDQGRVRVRPTDR